MADEFSFNVTKQHGVISESKTGWKMELNSVSWNGREEKYDIRSWSPDHEKMGKGITLTQSEIQTLKDILNTLQFEQPINPTENSDKNGI